ncbi:unnamed protein product [Fasciola hepatica]|uniref:Uncharacterized protein n=1 Tax=Fasciola hepatica TaxID=6192 RepID=A0ABC9HGD0_FASHE
MNKRLQIWQGFDFNLQSSSQKAEGNIPLPPDSVEAKGSNTVFEATTRAKVFSAASADDVSEGDYDDQFDDDITAAATSDEDDNVGGDGDDDQDDDNDDSVLSVIAGVVLTDFFDRPNMCC